MADLAALEAYLRRAPYLHAYELGDLDPRAAPHTTWFASAPDDAAGGIAAIAGVHVYAPALGIASLGNIEWRVTRA